jgi:phage baseplate assembly protein W
MLTDLLLTRRALGSQNSDRGAIDLQMQRGDLSLTSGRANLAQAILNRLMTRQGELSALGHPDYGSRLYQIIGEPNTRRTQALADFYIRESLAAEERIAEIIAITIAPPSLQADRRNVLDILITVRPIAELAGDANLNLSLTLNLEG